MFLLQVTKEHKENAAVSDESFSLSDDIDLITLDDL